MNVAYLHSLLRSGDYAVLTGENPRSKKRTPAVNSILNGIAWDTLKRHGYKPIKCKGYFSGNEENCFLVPKMTRKDAKTFMRIHQQECVAFGNHLQFETGEERPMRRTEFTYDEKPEGDYTEIKIGSRTIYIQLTYA